MHNTTSELITMQRDCEAILIPSGDPIKLIKGTHVRITQALGGDFTLFVNGKLTLKYSSRKKEPRGFFCLMGSCQECLVLVNDRIVLACQEIVEEGIIIKTGINK